MRKAVFLSFLCLSMVGTAVYAEHQKDGVCMVATDIAAWSKSEPYLMKKHIERFGADFNDLCRTQPTTEEFVTGRARFWLARVDVAERALTDALIDEVNKTGQNSVRIRLLSAQVHQLQAILGPMRELAYHAEEVREVVREVPADCPDVRGPDPRDECDRALRQSADRWLAVINDITKFYGENGRSNTAFSVLNDVRREMRGLPADATNMVPLVASWEQRLSRAAADRANNEGWFPLSDSERSRIESLADDMDLQLSFCGRRHDRRR